MKETFEVEAIEPVLAPVPSYCTSYDPGSMAIRFALGASLAGWYWLIGDCLQWNS
jgi:hypothetical protein